MALSHGMSRALRGSSAAFAGGLLGGMVLAGLASAQERPDCFIEEAPAEPAFVKVAESELAPGAVITSGTTNC